MTTMRKILVTVMVACILLGGCGSAKAEPTTVAAEQATVAAEQATVAAEQATTAAEQATTAAEQATTAAEQATTTSEQATTAAEQATTTAEQATTTAEQAAPAQADTVGADSVIIVFDDGVEVVAVKDGDVYRCTSSNGHTFKYEGEEIPPGRYLISDEAVKSWSGLLLFDRKVNGW